MSALVRKRVLAAAVVFAVVAATAITGVALTGAARDLPGVGDDGQADVRFGARHFSITGDAVRPVSPGKGSAIDVTFTNPRGRRMKVTGLRVTIREVTAPNATARRPCSLTDFRVKQARRAFAVGVPPHATRSLSQYHLRRGRWPRLRMKNRPVNQNGCKGASLTLAYRASGSFRR